MVCLPEQRRIKILVHNVYYTLCIAHKNGQNVGYVTFHLTEKTHCRLVVVIIPLLFNLKFFFKSILMK